MDADAAMTALRDVKNAGLYLTIAAEPMLLSVEGAKEIGHKMLTLAEAYENLHRAFGMVLAHLAAPTPN